MEKIQVQTHLLESLSLVKLKSGELKGVSLRESWGLRIFWGLLSPCLWRPGPGRGLNKTNLFYGNKSCFPNHYAVMHCPRASTTWGLHYNLYIWIYSSSFILPCIKDILCISLDVLFWFIHWSRNWQWIHKTAWKVWACSILPLT